jgi:hypothetical protein
MTTAASRTEHSPDLVSRSNGDFPVGNGGGFGGAVEPGDADGEGCAGERVMWTGPSVSAVFSQTAATVGSAAHVKHPSANIVAGERV